MSFRAIIETGMKYDDLIEMWNEENEQQWCDISEETKINFAFNEGRRTGHLDIAQIAGELSESEL